MPILVNPYRFGAAAASYSAEVLADSPLVWPRQGDPSGSTMTDSSGNVRHGTYPSVPTLAVAGLVAGDADTAANFNGSTNYGSIADAAWMDVANITVEAIIKPDVVNVIKSIIDRDQNGASRIFQFRVSNTAKLQMVYWTTTGGPFTVSGATSLVAGTAYHVAAVYDGATLKLYLNGAQDASVAQAGSLQVGTALLAVGRNSSAVGGAAWFDGVIDEPAMYGTALSAARIDAHATAAGY